MPNAKLTSYLIFLSLREFFSEITFIFDIKLSTRWYDVCIFLQLLYMSTLFALNLRSLLCRLFFSTRNSKRKSFKELYWPVFAGGKWAAGRCFVCKGLETHFIRYEVSSSRYVSLYYDNGQWVVPYHEFLSEL